MKSALALLCLLAAAPLAAQTPPTIVSGVVTDAVSGQPLRLAVVRVAATGVTQLTNDRGRYTLRLAPGPTTLDVRMIGYAPITVTLDVGNAPLTRAIAMTPAPYQLADITSGMDEAERIIREAIARKRDIRRTLQDYRYDAEVKLVARDMGKSADSADALLMLTDSRIEAHWQRPDHFQERIVARRQSANVKAANNLVSVGELLNFDRDRIEIDPYQLVSPIADDALKSYRYRILDTLRTPDGPVFRLAILPRSETLPLFTGVIDIADSTYRVLGFDVGFNRGVQLDFVKELRYRQRLADQGNGFWMPREIVFSAEIALGVPLPGVPKRMYFEQHAVLSGFAFDTKETVADRDYRLVVDDSADVKNHPIWQRAPALPLSEGDSLGLARIDSVGHARAARPIARIAFIATALLLGQGPDLLHFNRVDGAYLGYGRRQRLRPDLFLDGKLGYGFGDKRVQYRAGASVRLDHRGDLWLDANYHDLTRTLPTFPSSGDATPMALFGTDPFDYFRERGAFAQLRYKPQLHWNLSASYRDAKQTSLGVASDYVIGKPDHPLRGNPRIVEGRWRTFGGAVSYDSRPVIRNKGADIIMGASQWTTAQASVEVSAPSLLASVAPYRRVMLSATHRRLMGSWGSLMVTGLAGFSGGQLPVQRGFGIDYGVGLPGLATGGFITLDDTTFSGSRVVAGLGEWSLGRRPFVATGIPLIRDIPFTLSVHGGAFRMHQPTEGGTAGVSADRTYGELGFGIGNLTPFLAPFNLGVSFTWQLSRYRTQDFRFQMSMNR